MVKLIIGYVGVFYVSEWIDDTNLLKNCDCTLELSLLEVMVILDDVIILGRKVE